MKKIMFNDKYGLTNAVLRGKKTQTRRIIKFGELDAKYAYEKNFPICGSRAECAIIRDYSRYKVCEVVAVAQAYKNCINDLLIAQGYKTDIAAMVFKKSKGWNNKMFVRADLMPHRIRITDVRVERLQDISDEDCIKEGIRDYSTPNEKRYGYSDFEVESIVPFRTPREAYASLIDKISGKGTWESNPFVFVYDFEFIK